MIYPKVSVIIPCFNRLDEVTVAIGSLIHEADLIFEVIIIDDASPLSLHIKHPPDPLKSKIRVIRLDSNRGAAGARQAGVEAARGDLIAFLDSDDVWLPGKLNAQLPFFRDNGDLIAVATGWQVVDFRRKASRDMVRVPISSKDPSDFVRGCWFCPGSTLLLRRSAFDVVGPFNDQLRRLEDLEWFIRFGLAGGKLAVAPIVGALIRRSSIGHAQNVANAAEIILADCRSRPSISSELICDLRAWLDVEQAAALKAEGKKLAAMLYIARSLIRRPRFQIQLRRWWQELPPVIGTCDARNLLKSHQEQ